MLQRLVLQNHILRFNHSLLAHILYGLDLALQVDILVVDPGEGREVVQEFLLVTHCQFQSLLLLEKVLEVSAQRVDLVVLFDTLQKVVDDGSVVHLVLLKHLQVLLLFGAVMGVHLDVALVWQEPFLGDGEVGVL